ncbi:MAG TPA: UDPGP type 1 family protein [Pirellulales bacterium]|nr:UDPGP type 1 family protein [Pirellulales bacterium]
MTTVLYDDLLARLKPAEQEHLLAFWHELNEPARQSLAGQIDQIDLALVARLTRGGKAHQAWADLARRATPPPAIRLVDRASGSSATTPRKRGEQALAAGQVGLIIVAGGQGTRLGFPHPKGKFPIGPISQASLFQILLEKTLARGRSAGPAIPVYLMTSPATHDETLGFLEENRYFGLAPGDVTVFSQGTMPAVDARTHKLLLADRSSLCLSPDGHGGLLAALAQSGSLADARRRGVRYLFYVQVDNPLVSIGDPEFLGYHIERRSEVSTQVVAKRTLRDKVGNVVTIDGKLQILEYSDLNPLPDEIVDRRAADGSPVFWAGNIAVHIFDLAFLEQVADSAEGLPFHFAHKAVPSIDCASGRPVEPEKPNALKFERFIFDLLPAAERAIVYEVDAETAFAPVKNAPGESSDTPETVQRQMISLATQWLSEAGAKVDPGVPVEISPLLAQDAAELARRIPAALHVTQPRYFC